MVVLAFAVWPAYAGPPECGYVVAAQHPHDTEAFTQGLFVHQGALYESTGRYGRSTLREVDAQSGAVVRQWDFPRTIFAEGACAVAGEAVVLSWKAGQAQKLRLMDLAPSGSFAFSGQGWGLTFDGVRFIQSDGGAELIFRDAKTFAETGRVTVTAAGKPLTMLNELEFARGRVLANVWLTDRVAIIDPENGRVTGWLDLSPLKAEALPGRTNPDAVANGLAWNPGTQRLYATGKLWPLLFELELRDCPAFGH